MESPQVDDEGLYIAAYLEEALPDNVTLQVKMAHTMQAQERETRWCWKCNQPGNLQRDHDKVDERGPSHQRGHLKTSPLRRGSDRSPLSQVKPDCRQALKGKGVALSKSQPLLSVYRP